jgi:hypothetical protein
MTFVGPLVPILLASSLTTSPLVYLNFSDGTEKITEAATDDAPLNQSSVPGASGVSGAFEWHQLAESRVQAIDEAATKVDGLYEDFNVTFTLTRPAAAPYTMVFIGGDGTSFGLPADVAGLGRIECAASDDDVVFVVPGDSAKTTSQLARMIAHELGHSFGLGHEDLATDVMYPVTGEADQSFQVAEANVLDGPVCGRDVQSSHEQLMRRLGPSTGGPKELVLLEPLSTDGDASGGCSLSNAAREAGGDEASAAFLMLAAIATARRHKRRLPASGSTSWRQVRHPRGSP